MNRRDEARARQDWLLHTWGGEVRRAFDLPDVVSYDEAEARVDLVDAEYRQRFGRRLTDAERASVHQGATIPHGPAAVVSGDSHDIAKRLGWGVIDVHDYRQGRDLIMRDEQSGEWTGPYVGAHGEHAPADPEMVSRVRDAEAHKAAMAARAAEYYAANPVMRTVTGPS